MKPPYTPPAHFVAWLDEALGRSAYFGKIDPGLFPPIITKMKRGLIPITLEYALRLERAQMPSDKPLKAYDLMTFQEHRDLYLYVTGQQPAPAPIPRPPRKTQERRPPKPRPVIAPGSMTQPRTPVAG
jgi:hypothetical protein